MIKIRTIIKAYFFSVLFCFSLYASDATHVVLRALDSQGHELSQAQLGKPFLLEVAIQGGHGNLSDPVIENAPSAGAVRVGYKMHTVNGVSKINYTYKTRIDSEGTHQVGPAVIDDGGHCMQSNVVTVKVGRDEVARHHNGAVEKNKKLFLQLAVKHDRVVVGQKIEGTITFYSRCSEVLIRQLMEPAVEGFVKTGPEAPEQGEQDVDGQMYRYVRWNWQLVPQKSGKLVIPACSVDIVAQSDETDFTGGFGALFRFGATQQQIYSNALTVHVDQLPANGQKVDAVGVFRNFTASVNQTVAREGDGIALTLSLEGDGNFDQFNLELQSLPPIFKSYSSKQNIEELKNKPGWRKKIFEFVVQGMEPGEWNIPEQVFTYYDVMAKNYKTLKTSPLTLKILRHALTKNYQAADDELSTAVETVVKVDDDVLPLNHCDSWCSIPERKIPWTLFMLLFFTPLFIWFSTFMRRGWLRLIMWRGPKARWKGAFKNAHRHVDRAQHNNNIAALYAVFVELFALRCGVTPAQVSDEMTRTVLTKAGFSLEQVTEWEKFFAQISAYVFYSVQGKDQEKQLFHEADTWIDRLEKIL